jgi:hypothetical protein
VPNISDVKETAIPTAESLVPSPGCLVIEIAIKNLKNYTSPGIDQTTEELTKQEAIHKFNIPFGIRKDYLISESSLLLY